MRHSIQTSGALLGLLFFILIPCFPARTQNEPLEQSRAERQDARPRALSGAQLEAVLRAAYPDAEFSFADGPEGRLLRLDGHELPLAPHARCPQANPEDKNPPLCAMFAAYPTGKGGRHPEQNFDPGRIRNEAFFKALYGDSSGEVQLACVPVSFFGTKVMFNSRHGAAKALARVAARLEAEARKNPEIMAWVLPVSGAFYWRVIKNSGRLSAHSFGIAIDLNAAQSPYWLWKTGRTKLEAVRRAYPQAIVDAFEAEGFIWGGKWHAYDFMHFEFRPELIRAF